MRRRLVSVLSWLILLGLWAYVCAPLLLGGGEQLFLGGLSGDGIATVWFYDLLGRTLPAAPGDLSDFNWPWPHATRAEFPSVADAAISGLVLRVLGWRAGWGWVQALALGINALGAAALARAAGARGAGVVAAGGMALLCRQLWFDLICARMNAVWPGFALLAVAAVLLLLRRDGRPWIGQVLLVAVGAVAGANAALIYPPHLAAVLPAGLLLVLGPLRQARGRERLWAVLPALIAVAWVWPELSDIAGVRQGRDCTRLACPDAYHALSVAQLALWGPQPDGLSDPGLYGTTWLALPLILLHRQRVRLLLVALSALPLVGLALGPCPSAGPVGRSLESLPGLWCTLSHLSDYGRAATVAALLAAVLGGLGVSALPGAPVRAVAAGGLLLVTWSLLRPEYLDADKWKVPTVPAAAGFLRTADDGAVVELPYDRSAQFLSVLEAPGHPRVNPLKPGPRAEFLTPTWAWLHALGRGLPAPDGEITRAELAALQIRWVLYEPDRCTELGARCQADDVARLTAILGDPRVEAGGRLLIWSLP